MSMEMEHHAEMVPRYKKLYRVPECKLERKFKDRSSEAVNKDMDANSYTKLTADQNQQNQAQA